MKVKVQNTGECGYVIIGLMTFGEGEHELWNYEEIKEWPDFKKLAGEGKIIELVDEHRGLSPG